MKTILLAASLAVMPLALAPVLMPVAAQAAPAKGALGDLSSFEAIAADTLALIEKGDMIAAQKRITDFETAWDSAQSELYHKDKAAWGVVDDAADAAIKALRAKKPVTTGAMVAVSNLIAAIRAQ